MQQEFISKIKILLLVVCMLSGLTAVVIQLRFLYTLITSEQRLLNSQQIDSITVMLQMNQTALTDYGMSNDIILQLKKNQSKYLIEYNNTVIGYSSDLDIEYDIKTSFYIWYSISCIIWIISNSCFSSLDRHKTRIENLASTIRSSSKHLKSNDNYVLCVILHISYYGLINITTIIGFIIGEMYEDYTLIYINFVNIITCLTFSNCMIIIEAIGSSKVDD